MKKLFFYVSLYFLPLAPSLGQEAPEGSEVTVEFEEEKETQSISGVERIFRNPTLATSLAQGAQSINRSIDSLMEALFYKVMDNEIYFDLTDSSKFHLGLKRDLFETKDGAYVVVDKLSLGPRFSAPLTTVMGLPIFFGGSGSVNVLDIYLRNDGQRFVEEEELSYFRTLANNWFGLLPLLTAILPPSFNPNEMYDPIGQLETPFLFPETVQKAMAMNVGNLRSYAVSAVVHFSLDFLGKKEKHTIGQLGQSFEASLPFKVFKEGEHRINVLRKQGSIFWVGLSSTDRIGHQLEGRAGRLFYVLSKATSLWSGLPAVILPIDFDHSDAKVFGYDRLYEFDLANKKSRRAFTRAVVGDFSVADAQSLDVHSGVKFQFTRYSKGRQVSSKTERNAFVQKSGRRHVSSAMEIKTEESAKNFYILEARAQLEDEALDVLVGPETVSFENRAFLRVKKKKGRYSIDRSVKSPIGLVLGMTIRDRFVDAMEYRWYLEDLRMFTGLPLKGAAKIPIRDSKMQEKFRRGMFLGAPLKRIQKITVTPLHLGKLTANASLTINTKEYETLISKSDLEIAMAFCRAFGVSEDFAWTFMDPYSSASMGSYLLAPLALFNLRFPKVDVSREISARLLALQKVREAKDPLSLRDALQDFVTTQYPLAFAAALSSLVSEKMPRSVVFTTKAKGRSSKEIKDLFASMDGKKFQSTEEKRVVERYEVIRKKLSRFKPEAMEERRERPFIKKVHLSSEADLDPLQSSLVLTLKVPKMKKLKKQKKHKKHKKQEAMRAFLRMEQGGKVNVGRFVLFEGVIHLEKVASPKEGGLESYSVRLTGSQRAFKSFMVDQALSLGGEFSIFVSVTYGGDLWSRERKVGFRYQGGKLLRPGK